MDLHPIPNKRLICSGNMYPNTIDMDTGRHQLTSNIFQAILVGSFSTYKYHLMLKDIQMCM